MKEKIYTLQLTESEVQNLANKLFNENVELVNRLEDGQQRIALINKMASLIKLKEKQDV